MKPVNWNDPDLVGKKIFFFAEENDKVGLIVTAIGEFNFLAHLVSKYRNGFTEVTYKKKEEKFYYEEPEEEKRIYSYKCTACERFVRCGVNPEKPDECRHCGVKDCFEISYKKLLAPALLQHRLKHDDGTETLGAWFLSNNFYCDEFQVRKAYKFNDDIKVVSWPAIPNKDGFYEVSDEAL